MAAIRWKLLVPESRAEYLLYGALIGGALVFGLAFDVLGPALAVGCGLALLNHYADTLIEGCVALSDLYGASRLAVGVVVLGFGTSLPELVTSVMAAAQARTEMVIGNVTGSNIANVMVALGLAIAVHPLRATLRSVRRDLYPMLLASALFVAFVLSGIYTGAVVGGGTEVVSRLESLVLVAALATYLFLVFRRGRSDPDSVAVEAPHHLTRPEAIVLTLGGMAGLVGGSALLLEGAVGIARAAGVTERVIGLTILAVGTSLPEIVTAWKSARAGEPMLVLGNVLGSNLFNILAVAGLSGMIRPLALVSGSLDGTRIDLALMMGCALLLLPALLWGRFPRLVGWALLGGYGGYIAWLLWG